jgi:hypothetical protein
MSDNDDANKQPLVFLSKPPKKINEMTDEERAAYAEKLAQKLNPANRSA